MTGQRLARSKYLRQLDVMLTELHGWRQRYREQAALAANRYRAEQLYEREQQINKAMGALGEVYATLEQLPRISR